MSKPEYISLDAAEYQALFTSSFCITATTALYYYDWLLMLDLEIKHIWSSKWTVSSWIFTVNRYATLVNTILLSLPSTDQTSCTWEVQLSNVCIILQALSLALFTGLRTYALCDQRRWIFLIVIGLAGVPAIGDLILDIKGSVKFFESSIGGLCEMTLSSDSQELRLSLACCLMFITADAIAFIVAWRKAVDIVREASRTSIRVPLSTVLIRDGSILFLSQLLLKVVQVLMSNVPSLQVAGFRNLFIAPLSTILMCRFMLNLKQAGDPDSETGLDSLSIILGPMSRIHFTQNHDQSQSVASGDSEAGCISQLGHADTHILTIKGRSDIQFANIV